MKSRSVGIIETVNYVALRRRVRYRMAGTGEKPFVAFAHAPVVSTKAVLNSELMPVKGVAMTKKVSLSFLTRMVHVHLTDMKIEGRGQ